MNMTNEDAVLVKAIRPLVERGILAAIKDGNLEAALDRTRDAFLVNYDSVGYYEDMLDEVLGAGHLSLEVVRTVRRHAFKQRDSAPIRPPIGRTALDKEMSDFLSEVIRRWSVGDPFHLLRSMADPTLVYVVSLVGPCGSGNRRVNVMGKISTVNSAGERRSMVLKDLPRDRMAMVQSFDDPSTYRTYWVWALRANDGDELKMWLGIQLNPQDEAGLKANNGRRWREECCLQAVFNHSAPQGYRLTPQKSAQ